MNDVANRNKENIYNDILELSDLRLQRKLWLNENNDTELISSYVELMCRLFDDNSFDVFVDKSASEMKLPLVLITQLDKLRVFLTNYKEKETDFEILNDSEWQKIVQQAKVVIDIWKSFDDRKNK